MTYAQDNGYTPVDIPTLMDALRVRINTEFNTTYTAETFVGSNWYKFGYQVMQQVQTNEIKTSEIFLKLQEYIAQTNAKIQRPSVSNPGIIDSFESHGYVASVKKMIEADAGKIHICVDVDETAPTYAATRLAICQLIKDYVVGGVVSMGTESETIVLSNGQGFDFKFYLPSRTPVLLRLKLWTSDNTLLSTPSDEVIREQLFENISNRYRLGWNFEPQRYFETISDAPWAESVLLEYSSDDGANWYSVVLSAQFDDLLTYSLEDIEVLINP